MLSDFIEGQNPNRKVQSELTSKIRNKPRNFQQSRREDETKLVFLTSTNEGNPSQQECDKTNHYHKTNAMQMSNSSVDLAGTEMVGGRK